MERADDAVTLYTTAIGQSQTAFGARLYAVAYHELAAAMHAAYALEDEDLLSAVGEVAQQQCAWLNAHEPEQEVDPDTTWSSGRHGRSVSQGLWRRIEREARMLQGVLRQRRRFQQMQQVHEKDDAPVERVI
jgi:hypothetical protein